MLLSKNTFFLAIIGALIITIILMRSCSGPSIDNKPQIVTVTKIDTVYKTIHKEISVYTPPITKYIKVEVPVLTKVDTAKIIENYYTKNYYKDKIKIDSFGYVFINDTIFQNKILDRKVTFDYKIPTITKTITNTITLPPRRQFFGGFDLIVGKNIPITYIGPSLSYKDRKESIYNIGLGVSSDGNIMYKFGLQWKIKIK